MVKLYKILTGNFNWSKSEDNNDDCIDILLAATFGAIETLLSPHVDLGNKVGQSWSKTCKVSLCVKIEGFYVLNRFFVRNLTYQVKKKISFRPSCTMMMMIKYFESEKKFYSSNF